MINKLMNKLNNLREALTIIWVVYREKRGKNTQWYIITRYEYVEISSKDSGKQIFWLLLYYDQYLPFSAFLVQLWQCSNESFRI